MSLAELAALARRHAVAFTMVLVFAAGTAYTFKHTPPTYGEAATFVLKAPGSGPYSTYGGPLINTGEVVAEWMMGPQGQQQVHQDGTTDAFDVALVNYSNQEYPYYRAPYFTVSASAHDPVTTHRAFTTVSRVFNDYLAAWQESVPPDKRITVGVIGDTGPVIERGSSIRSFAGLLVLTIVIAFLVFRFLDRHPLRLRGHPLRLRDQLRFLQRAARRPAVPRSVP